VLNCPHLESPREQRPRVSGIVLAVPRGDAADTGVLLFVLYCTVVNSLLLGSVLRADVL
jgi:hypothetical protein